MPRPVTAFSSSSYCTAEEYNVIALLQHLQEQGVATQAYDNVVHIERTQARSKGKHAFFFPYGCAVFWGFSSSEEDELLELVRSFAIRPSTRNIHDRFPYTYGTTDKTHIIEEEDHIVLGNKDVILAMLSISHAMAQSVKLTFSEESVLNTIRRTRPLTEELSTNGKISMSRHKLTQQIGSLFVERHSINLHGDILDTPEFFWRRPKFEPIYHLAAEFLDIGTRLEILNRRSNVVHELYEVLSDELNHSHSSRLEWIIIWLIATEIALTLLKELSILAW
jgi:uncharacterized Rmd1/YagE family protein